MTADSPDTPTFGVRNWRTFQHYNPQSRSAPPWIKLYLQLLDDPEVEELPEATRWHLVAIFMLAGKLNNVIPAKPGWVAKRIGAETPVRWDLLRPWLEGSAVAWSALLAGTRGRASTPASTGSEEVLAREEKRRGREEERRGDIPATAAPPSGGGRPGQPGMAVAERKPKSWSQEAVDDWQARYPDATPPGARIGSGLRSLVQRLGWAVVRPVWQHYLASEEARFANPQSFASKYDSWREQMEGVILSRGGQETLRNAHAFVAGEDLFAGEGGAP